MPIHVSEATDAAFATRFRQALSDAPHRHIPRTHYESDEALMVLSDSVCPWPAPAQARFLVQVALNTVLKRYHIVRKSTVLEGLEKAIQNPAVCDRLLICKLWALFALGVIYSTKAASSESSFPGIAYFARASRMLYATTERPRLDSIEIMLLLVRCLNTLAGDNRLKMPQGVYSLALNRRHSAYYLASSAIRLGVILGLHLDVPCSQLSDRGIREHRIRIWWTAFCFDRMWASKLGQPVSIQDDLIQVDLPSGEGLAGEYSGDFGDPDYLKACVQLAKLAEHVISSLYARRKQQGAFSQRVQQALRDLGKWVGDLPSRLQLATDVPSQTTPNHIIFMHLTFNQVGGGSISISGCVN